MTTLLASLGSWLANRPSGKAGLRAGGMVTAHEFIAVRGLVRRAPGFQRDFLTRFKYASAWKKA